MKAERPAFVLDSFALLAYLQDEAGSGQVSAVLKQGEKSQAEVLMCVVNLGEALYILERQVGLPEMHRIISAIDQLPIDMIDAGRGFTLTAAHIKAHLSISYADAFAVALAQQHQATVLTGAPEFEKARNLVAIRWLPRR